MIQTELPEGMSRIGVVALRAALADLDPALDAPAWMDSLVRAGLDRLPLPGSGGTLVRWQALAAVAAHDLSLAKLYEGHTDALAILTELGASTVVCPGQTWCVWAAESPPTRAVLTPAGDGTVSLDGEKSWCSGAATASHALLTAWHADDRGPQLVRVAISQPRIEVSAAAWRAVGMAGSASLDVILRGARAHEVGRIGDYLSRPGFWQGGAGVAACWYGGAAGLAHALRDSLLRTEQSARSPFRLAAAGKVEVALHATAAVLREAAKWIDEHPTEDASRVALRARLAAEACATCVLDEAGRALGAAAFCRDTRFARAAADLPVFIRQSHAERDYAALAERMLSSTGDPWAL